MLPEHILFKNQQSHKVEITTEKDLPQALKILGLETNSAVIVMIGGAGGVSDEDRGSICQVIEVIALAAQNLGVVVIDGGTQSGIMEMMGLIRNQNGYQFPLLGVCAIDTVTWPGKSQRFFDRIWRRRGHLDPNHTHFVLVPGENWGDDSAWIAKVASQIAGRRPSVAILINGGQIAREQDIPNNLKENRKIFVIEGTGRVADELATSSPDPDLMKFIHLKNLDRLTKILNQHLQIT